MIIARGLGRASRKFFGGDWLFWFRGRMINLSAAAEAGAQERLFVVPNLSGR
jgi:hypothetical protein